MDGEGSVVWSENFGFRALREPAGRDWKVLRRLKWIYFIAGSLIMTKGKVWFIALIAAFCAGIVSLIMFFVARSYIGAPLVVFGFSLAILFAPRRPS